mmetsp:Transcript_55547/g.126279  ORF Transcript_55547/g.126279 Transcript_55547/m.126279 type:complete len:201 (+) Transcript_55547:880-1482(+)
MSSFHAPPTDPHTSVPELWQILWIGAFDGTLRLVTGLPVRRISKTSIDPLMLPQNKMLVSFDENPQDQPGPARSYFSTDVLVFVSRTLRVLSREVERSMGEWGLAFMSRIGSLWAGIRTLCRGSTMLTFKTPWGSGQPGENEDTTRADSNIRTVREQLVAIEKPVDQPAAERSFTALDRLVVSCSLEVVPADELDAFCIW